MTLEMTKRCLCLGLLVLVSFVMSLPRAQDALAPRTGSFTLAGHLSQRSAWLLPGTSRKTGSEGLDMRLLKIRKLRRRRSSFGLTSHLQASYHQAPSLNDAGHYMPAVPFLLSRELDPLVHPPA